MNKPKYLSRFTYNSAVNVMIAGQPMQCRPGTVKAVKFSESGVHYDVMIDGELFKDCPSMAVYARADNVPEYTAYVETAK